MTALELIDELERRGVELRLLGETLQIRPDNGLSAGLGNELRTKQAEIVAILRQATADARPEPTGSADSLVVTLAPSGKSFEVRRHWQEIPGGQGISGVPLFNDRIGWRLDISTGRLFVKLMEARHATGSK